MGWRCRSGTGRFRREFHRAAAYPSARLDDMPREPPDPAAEQPDRPFPGTVVRFVDGAGCWNGLAIDRALDRPAGYGRRDVRSGGVRRVNSDARCYRTLGAGLTTDSFDGNSDVLLFTFSPVPMSCQTAEPSSPDQAVSGEPWSASLTGRDDRNGSAVDRASDRPAGSGGESFGRAETTTGEPTRVVIP